MTAVTLALAAILAVAVVLLVARPFLAAHSSEGATGEPDEPEPERLHLLEERDRALAALKELEFDHRTGKISDADYADAVGLLRREAADALAAADAARSQGRE